VSDDDILPREAVNLEDVMREVKALREEVRGWIPVDEDNLPEFGRFVLIGFADGGVDMSSRIRHKRRGGWFWEGVSETHHYPPTHWMELPRGPKMGSDAS
jgi:hypothetical protein